jgi:hypothetical protein
MPPRNTPNPSKRDDIVSQAKRGQADREKSYREQAMKLFPHVCGRCTREFSGKTLRELTVHHKDHDHDNNPPDGSNWELLCLYCHDEEHKNTEAAGYQQGTTAYSDPDAGDGFNPFAGLQGLFPSDEDK